VGLYRAEVDDLAKKFLQVLGQMVDVFDIAKLSSYLGIVDKLADGLYGLLGLQRLELRIGVRDVFQSSAEGVAPRRDSMDRATAPQTLGCQLING
jgi:hypothetical protein